MKIQSLTDEAAVRLLSASNALDEMAIDRGLVHGTGIRVTAPQIASNILLIAAAPLALVAALGRKAEGQKTTQAVQRGSVIVVSRPQLAAYC